MADISITAANVVPGANAKIGHGRYGATVTQGQVVYKDATDNDDVKLADGDSATAAVRVPVGIALNAGSDGQPASWIEKGPVTIGATLTPGLPYYLSPNPGGIGLIAEVAVGDDYVCLGHATSASVLEVDIKVTGVTRAS
jgi:hypothetical protein